MTSTRHRPALVLVGTALMVLAYFLLPLDHFGPHRPGLSWATLVGGLALVAVLLLLQIQQVLAERSDTRAGWTILGLMCLTVLVFSAAYYVLAKEPGQFIGLTTRIDALYFTVVTLATVGYGDISPSGQTARALTLVLILYGLVFLSAGATAVSRRLRTQVQRRAEQHGGRGGGTSG